MVGFVDLLLVGLLIVMESVSKHLLLTIENRTELSGKDLPVPAFLLKNSLQ